MVPDFGGFMGHVQYEAAINCDSGGKGDTSHTDLPSLMGLWKQHITGVDATLKRSDGNWRWL
jgi:hypothetical protein